MSQRLCTTQACHEFGHHISRSTPQSTPKHLCLHCCHHHQRAPFVSCVSQCVHLQRPPSAKGLHPQSLPITSHTITNNHGACTRAPPPLPALQHGSAPLADSGDSHLIGCHPGSRHTPHSAAAVLRGKRHMPRPQLPLSWGEGTPTRAGENSPAGAARPSLPKPRHPGLLCRLPPPPILLTPFCPPQPRRSAVAAAVAAAPPPGVPRSQPLQLQEP